MSGIFGFFKRSTEGSVPDNKDIYRMAAWNRAYGNGAKDFFVSSVAAFGVYLEKINESIESCKGVMKSGNCVSVVDAIIYNRSELLNKLNGALSTDVSDEELLFACINRFGYDFLEKINGDFSGVVYDEKEKSIILFRDHMGIRPLYYYCCNDFVCFSTDLRGIVAISEVDATISEEWIYKTLGGYNPYNAVSTEYSNIFCAKPGCYYKFTLEYNGIVKKSTTYWQIGRKKIKLGSDKDYQKRLRELIEDSIKIRLDTVSGIVGAELSGGLDSGVIDILINRFGRDAVYYSWSSSPDKLEMADNDERLVIKDICDQEGITCKYGSLDMGEGTLIAERYKATGATIDYDEMPAYRYALPPYINALTIVQTAEELKKDGASVVFSGHGGDEGVSHRCNPYEMLRNKEYFHYYKYMYSTTVGFKKRHLNAMLRCRDNIKHFKEGYGRPFVGGINAPDVMNADLLAKFDPEKMPVLYFPFDPIAYIKDGGSRNRLDNVAILGAYCGVRYFVPYLDYRVVDYAVSIPRNQYIRYQKNRYIFKETFKDIIPESLYNLTTKEDHSHRSIKPDPNWFESFNNKKKEIISKLDRKFWVKYLDFDKIDEFEKSGEPNGEEKNKQRGMMYCLCLLGLAQNLVEKVRTANYEFEEPQSDFCDNSGT